MNRLHHRLSEPRYLQSSSRRFKRDGDDAPADMRKKGARTEEFDDEEEDAVFKKFESSSAGSDDDFED